MKRYYKLLTASILCLVLGSCNKWLELKPEDGIVRQEFWQTKEQVQSALIGCYSSLLASPPGVSDRPMADYLFMWGEVRADMVTPAANANNDERDLATVNILSTNSIANWRCLYRTINYCNTVIDLAPGVLAKDPTFTKASLNSTLAEAKGLRALMYFYLARTFRDVPLKLTATLSDADDVQIPKSTQKQVFEQIVKDLNEAEVDAPTTFNVKAMEKGRITKYAINAMQADVYLWLEQYDKAVIACDKVITAGKFGLTLGTTGWFTTVYANGNSTESIFEFQFDQQILNPFYNMFVTRPRYLATPRVVDEVFGVDYLDETKFDIRADGASLKSFDLSIYKYAGINRVNRKSQDQSDTHWFVYRYPDVLLMKAEAVNQLGDGATALTLIKQIRDRARALVETEQAPQPTDKEGVTDYILEERAREFAFEGKRWYDVLRNASRENYKRMDILLNMITYSAPPDKQQTILSKYRDINSHYLPIYFYELQTNKALVQNPFYE